MIEPQAGQRGVIGEQHGLTRLTTTLERIEAGQRAQQLREMLIDIINVVFPPDNMSPNGLKTNGEAVWHSRHAAT